MKRVVVTGMAGITSLGSDWASIEANFIAGCSVPVDADVGDAAAQLQVVGQVAKGRIGAQFFGQALAAIQCGDLGHVAISQFPRAPPLRVCKSRCNDDNGAALSGSSNQRLSDCPALSRMSTASSRKISTISSSIAVA